MSALSPIINSMKKKKAPLGKLNNAIRKAESELLFKAMLNTKHTIVTPEYRKGSRQANKLKAIKESY